MRQRCWRTYFRVLSGGIAEKNVAHPLVRSRHIGHSYVAPLGLGWDVTSMGPSLHCLGLPGLPIPQDQVEAPRCLVVVAFDGVCILADGEARVAVSEPGLDGLPVGSVADEEGSPRVPEREWGVIPS